MPRIVLVTGASGGLGRAIVAGFEALGDYVLGLDLMPPAELGDRAIACDLTDAKAIADMLSRLEQMHGPIDVLVNNAAYCGQKSFFDLTPNEITRTLAVNVTAVLLLAQGFIAQRQRAGGGGAIVNVASIAGRRGSSQIEYGASKAGVINLTMTLARLVAGMGIRVNAVAPALVDAGMGERLSSAVRDGFLNATPMKRAASPQEIANIAIFLASEQASYVTGETIDAFGGL